MFGFGRQQQRVLHLTWIAFFLTFVCWFNMAPFNSTLTEVLGINHEQMTILMICNVALTIPARVLIGSATDRFGAPRVMVWVLVYTGLVSLYFSLATRFHELLVARLLMSIAGAGFVVGIKMIGEWFPGEKMGTAQGIYAGWGNFGAAAAAFSLPVIAGAFTPETGWRIATGFSGVLCLVWAAVYFRFAKPSPDRQHTFPITPEQPIVANCRTDRVLLILLMAPVYGALGLLVWKLTIVPVLTATGAWALCGGIASLYILNMILTARRSRKESHPASGAASSHEFLPVVILSLVYALTFGSELAVVSMFPEFLENTFALSVTLAGVLASSFAVLNLFTRPGGGWVADVLGHRRALVLCVGGAAFGFAAMSQIHAGWPVALAVGLALLCSIFVQAGNGACFARVPLIRKELTGSIAGIVGAYGNVGAVAFLTLLSLVDEPVFFGSIGLYAAMVLACLYFLKDNPKRATENAVRVAKP